MPLADNDMQGQMGLMNRHAQPVRWGSFLVALALSSGSAEARDPAQVRHFRKAHPCPATGEVRGACPGWVVDHIHPLCAGGPDHPSNMQWQSVQEAKVKDKQERKLCSRQRND